MWWKDLVFNKTTPDGQSTPIVVWDCAINWNHKLLIEHGKDVRQATASTDKMANELNAGAGTVLQALIGRKNFPALEKE